MVEARPNKVVSLVVVPGRGVSQDDNTQKREVSQNGIEPQALDDLVRSSIR